MNIQEAITDHEKNLAELADFYQQSKCEHNRNYLDSEIKRLKSKIEELKKSLIDLSDGKQAIRYKTIERYSWEQQDDQIKIYLDKDNFKEENVKKEKIKVELMDNDKTVIVFIDYYRLVIKNLYNSIKLENDSNRITKNFVIINLKKQENLNWPSLQKTKQSSTKGKGLGDFNTEENEDPSQSMMNMMKKMYQEGDDEMKRMINKAWSEKSKNQFY